MTWDQVLRNSPILHVPERASSLLLLYGEDENAEFKRPSDDFLTAWRAKASTRTTWPSKNHYDVIDGFLDAKSPLCSAVLELTGVR